MCWATFWAIFSLTNLATLTGLYNSHTYVKINRHHVSILIYLMLIFL
jgi:hypothetical protein